MFHTHNFNLYFQNIDVPTVFSVRIIVSDLPPNLTYLKIRWQKYEHVSGKDFWKDTSFVTYLKLD